MNVIMYFDYKCLLNIMLNWSFSKHCYGKEKLKNEKLKTKAKL